LPNRRRPDLAREARAFAGELSATLNRTVTDGLRLSVCMDPAGRAVVGKGVGRLSLEGDAAPLAISRVTPRLCLYVIQTLDLDATGRFLTTTRSSFALQTASTAEPVVTYDYTRDPPNIYPEAHFHVHGRVEAVQSMLERCGRRKDKPDDLHFPVGGRRFRPCLEDLIEFCILERLVEPRPGWEKALNESRQRFRDDQLRAAVRRSPDTAAGVLREQGWQVMEPDG